jgi:hypothetical protein
VKLFPHSGNITKQKASAKCTREVVDAVKKIMQNEPKTFRYLSQQVNFSIKKGFILISFPKDLYCRTASRHKGFSFANGF